MVRKRKNSSPLNPFYGYSVEEIVEWTGLSEGTIKHFKAGRRTPPIWVLRLIRIHRDQKLLGKEWEGYRVVGDKLFGPEGKFVRPSHIALQILLWQALAEAAPDKYYELLKKAANF